MPEIIHCTRCGAQYTATEQQIGTWAYCAGCGTTFMVAAPGAQQAVAVLHVEPVPASTTGLSAMPPGPSGALPPGDAPSAQAVPTAYAVAYAGPRQSTGMATAAMVLGIISLPAVISIWAGLICGGLAISFGMSARRSIRRGLMPTSARGLAQAGVICGGIGVTLSVIVAILAVVLLFSDLQAARRMRGARTPPPSMTSFSVAMPLPTILCDDGAQVPMALGTPLVQSDGTLDRYRYSVPGHGVGYVEYRCLATNKTWAYGKNGQITSPYISPPCAQTGEDLPAEQLPDD